MDEMLNVLTKGIGIELYKPLRIAYFNNKKFLTETEGFQKSSADIKQFLFDVLALSLFNQRIVIPFYGAVNFSSGTRPYGVTKIRMAEYNYDKEFFGKANKVTRQ